MGKFKRLVDSEKSMEKFMAKYRIPPRVGIKYAAQGEWVDDRKIGEVVIPPSMKAIIGITTSPVFLSSTHSP